MNAAAFQAGHPAAEWPHAVVLAAAMRATITVANALARARQREVVAALFIGEPEFAAGAAPLGAVRLDAAAAGAEMSDEMRKLMAQGFVHFLDAELEQLRIHAHEAAGVMGLAGGGAQPGMPADLYLRGEFVAADPAQQCARGFLEVGEFGGAGNGLRRGDAFEKGDEIKLAGVHAGCSSSRAKIGGRAAMVRSISSSLVHFPSEKRTVA